MNTSDVLWVASLLVGAWLVCGCAAAATDASVVNPHVSTDKSVDCSTADRILRDLVKDDMTDEQKVLACFNWIRRLIYHGDGIRKYAYNFHYLINVLGNGSCGRQTTPLAMLLHKLGYRSQNWTRNGHHMMQVFYGGRWHCLDPHMNFYVYDRSKPPTIASIEQLQEDPTLALDAVKEGRACPGFLLCGDSPRVFAGRSGRWKNYGEYPKGFHRPVVREPFGRITLRRGESYIRTWTPGKHWFKKNSWMKDSAPFHSCTRRDRKDTVNWPLYEANAAKVKYGVAYRHSGAGRIVYHPDLSTDHYLDAVVKQANLTLGKIRESVGLRPVDRSKPGEIIFSVNCPYAVTAGKVFARAVGEGAIRAAVSTDKGKTWQPLKPLPTSFTYASEFVDPVNGSFDGYWIRLGTSGRTVISEVKLTTEFQLNPYSLPYLVPGRNVVRVEAGSYGSPLTVKYEWGEGPNWAVRKSRQKTFRKSGSFIVDVAKGKRWPRMHALTLSVGR